MANQGTTSAAARALNRRMQIEDGRLMHSIRENALTILGASGPCSYASIWRECKTQVIGFEAVTSFHASVLIDKVLNSLLRSGEIEVESSYDSDTNLFEVVFDKI
jgi:hypothetical protein